MNSPLKKDVPKKRWTYRPIPKETWEAIRNESPAFVVKAIRSYESMLNYIRSLDFGNDCTCGIVDLDETGHTTDCGEIERNEKRDAIIAKAEGK